MYDPVGAMATLNGVLNRAFVPTPLTAVPPGPKPAMVEVLHTVASGVVASAERPSVLQRPGHAHCLAGAAPPAQKLPTGQSIPPGATAPHGQCQPGEAEQGTHVLASPAYSASLHEPAAQNAGAALPCGQ